MFLVFSIKLLVKLHIAIHMTLTKITKKEQELQCNKRRILNANK